jgi:hypothetical protein
MRGFGGLLLLMLIVGTIVRFWRVIALVVGIVLLGVALWKSTDWLDRRLDAWDAKRARGRERLAAIARRADEQHAQVLAGDDRGIYGDYAPKQIG